MMFSPAPRHPRPTMLALVALVAGLALGWVAGDWWGSVRLVPPQLRCPPAMNQQPR